MVLFGCSSKYLLACRRRRIWLIHTNAQEFNHILQNCEITTSWLYTAHDNHTLYAIKNHGITVGNCIAVRVANHLFIQMFEMFKQFRRRKFGTGALACMTQYFDDCDEIKLMPVEQDAVLFWKSCGFVAMPDHADVYHKVI